METITMTVPAVRVTVPLELAEFCGWWGERAMAHKLRLQTNPLDPEGLACKAFHEGAIGRSRTTVELLLPRREAALFADNLHGHITAAVNEYLHNGGPEVPERTRLRQGVRAIQRAVRLSLAEYPDPTIHV
jgi:hypothetical protein